MKKITYLLAFLLTGSALAQENCNLQYDGNGDGAVNVEDVLGVLSEFGEVCEPVITNWTCGDSVNYFGYQYATTLIGEQCWFAENLRTQFYQNGDSIMFSTDKDGWQDQEFGLQTVYGEINDYICLSGGNYCEPEVTLALYGRLYNWYVAADERNVCPIGWHVPSDETWIELEMALGMTETEAASYGVRGTNQGQLLKANLFDVPPFDGTDDFGFRALASGDLDQYNGYYGAQEQCYFWTSSYTWWVDYGFEGWGRGLSLNSPGISRISRDREDGCSIRCIKD